MPISTRIREVFAHFHNLNLLTLINDLRAGRVAHQAWFTGDRLCPVTHGMPAGEQVEILTIKGQSTDIHSGCWYAARHLGADRHAVTKFVREWDDRDMSPDFLLAQLEALWNERLEDADATQGV